MSRRISMTDEDRAIGARVREARTMAGMRLEDLAAAIGVTHQQLQKYEVGINRINITALRRLAEAQNRPITWFFDQDSDPVPIELDHALREILATCRELPVPLRAHLLDHAKTLREVAAKHREIAA